MTSRDNWDITPVRSPPYGQVSNLVDPPSIGSHFHGANVVCGAIFVGIGALRLCTRYFLVRRIGYDDYVCMLAMVFWAVAVVIFELDIRYGMGKHLWDLSLADYSPYFLLVWRLSSVVYITTMCAIKFSILMMYRRVFPIKAFANHWWFVAFFTFAYSMGGIFAGIFSCTPVNAAWDIMVAPRYCINVPALYIATTTLNFIDNVLVVLLPLPVVWNLSLENRQKVELSALFSIGSLSCVASILRLRAVAIYLILNDNDDTYYLANVGAWTQIELTVAMVGACLPTLRPLFEKCFGSGNDTDSSHGSDSRAIPRGSVRLPPYDEACGVEMDNSRKIEHTKKECAEDRGEENLDRVISQVPNKTKPVPPV